MRGEQQGSYDGEDGNMHPTSRKSLQCRTARPHHGPEKRLDAVNDWRTWTDGLGRSGERVKKLCFDRRARNHGRRDSRRWCHAMEQGRERNIPEDAGGSWNIRSIDHKCCWDTCHTGLEKSCTSSNKVDAVLRTLTGVSKLSLKTLECARVYVCVRVCVNSAGRVAPRLAQHILHNVRDEAVRARFKCALEQGSREPTDCNSQSISVVVLYGLQPS